MVAAAWPSGKAFYTNMVYSILIGTGLRIYMIRSPIYKIIFHEATNRTVNSGQLCHSTEMNAVIK